MGSGVYDQIVEIHHNIATVADVYLVVTGVLWGAVAINTLELPREAASVMLVFHLLGSLAVLQTLASNLNAIELRHEFLPTFGKRYYPDIEEICQQSFAKVYGKSDSKRAKYARWGRVRFLWYLIPIAGFVGSVFFIAWLWFGR